MKCPRCGGKWAVKNSRPGDAERTFERNGDLIAWAEALVGWWTPTDWVVRERVCAGCGHRQRSIEILEEDLPHLLREPEPPPEDDNG